MSDGTMHVPSWPCPDCLAINHPAATTCSRCGLTVPVGGDDE